MSGPESVSSPLTAVLLHLIRTDNPTLWVQCLSPETQHALGASGATHPPRRLVVSGGGKCRKETDTEATADAQLIEAGYPRWKLVIAGYTTQQMMDAGLTYTQVVDAKEDSYLNEDNQNPFAGPRVNGGLASQ